MKATAIILTCRNDRHIADLLVRGIEKHWPEVTPKILFDTDRSTETPLPEDVRDIVRKVPYLRKVFDVTALSDTDDIYVFDGDMLIYGYPEEFVVPRYMVSLSAPDDPIGVLLWRQLGVEYSPVSPRFCAGTYSAHKSMLDDNRELAIEYVRLCVKWHLHEVRYPGVICEQSLAAGLWRKTYPDAPLPADRYPVNMPVDGMVMFHIGALKDEPSLERVLADYRKHLET